MSKFQNFMINYEKFMRPSASCQVCCSETQISWDCIITCEICRSCIHQIHYGSELLTPSETWQCERCRYFMQNGSENVIQCEFCPNLRGIMKIYNFNGNKVWLHPECAAWGFPTLFFLTKKKETLKRQKAKSQSTYFWVSDYEENIHPCQVCGSNQGFTLKCKYHSCTRSYHITCARPYGIIRDLQSFKIENEQAYFPVYCRQHIELRINDYKQRAKELKQSGNRQKSIHFQKVSVLFQSNHKYKVEQLTNLQLAIEKCKQEQEITQKLIYETRKDNVINDNLHFSQIDDSFESQEQSEQYVKYLEQEFIGDTLKSICSSTIKEKNLRNLSSDAEKFDKQNNTVVKQQQKCGEKSAIDHQLMNLDELEDIQESISKNYSKMEQEEPRFFEQKEEEEVDDNRVRDIADEMSQSYRNSFQDLL